jgi:4-amino-4-deoxy-L-arabinose transferase-like glycosyltransferase
MLMSSKNSARTIFLFVVLSYIFFFLGNGLLGLTHPDEVFYTQTAKEMLQHHSWLVPYLFDGPNFEKPILSYWLFMAAFSLFGVGSYSARLFPAIFGTIGVIGVYLMGRRAFADDRKGLYGALVLMSSLLYIGLSRTVFTDMFFTVFIELSLASFYWAYLEKNENRKALGLLSFWMMAALAVLTKGILGLGIPLGVVVIFLLLRREMRFLNTASFWIGILLFLAVALPWYVYVIKAYGQTFIQEFFYNDHIRRLLEAEHKPNDKWFFYPFSMIGLMMPWSIFVSLAIWRLPKNIKNNSQPIYMFLAVWLGVTFCIFQAAHSKLVSYIFPLFPALALMTGDYLGRIIAEKPRKLFMISALAVPICLAAGTIFAAIQHAHYHLDQAKLLESSFVSLAVIAGIIFSIWKKDGPRTRMIVVMVQIPLIMVLAFWNHEAFEDYASAKEPCRYLLTTYDVKGPILCSKHFLRSTRFFTDKEVVMLNIRGTQSFFSPHPVQSLKSKEDVAHFLKGGPYLYGILKKGEMQDLKDLIKGDFQMEELKVVGDEHLVRISISTGD